MVAILQMTCSNAFQGTQYILFLILLNFVLSGSIDNKSALVQGITWWQAVTCTRINPVLWWCMMSPGHNKLTHYVSFKKMNVKMFAEKSFFASEIHQHCLEVWPYAISWPQWVKGAEYCRILNLTHSLHISGSVPGLYVRSCSHVHLGTGYPGCGTELHHDRHLRWTVCYGGNWYSAMPL